MIICKELFQALIQWLPAKIKLKELINKILCPIFFFFKYHEFKHSERFFQVKHYYSLAFSWVGI